MVYTDQTRRREPPALPETSSLKAQIKLPLGEVMVTAGAVSALSPDEIRSAVLRHSQGDWGELDIEDAQMNDLNLQKGGPIGSIYTSAKGQKFYVVTESDRATTTVLLPEEY